MIPGKNYYKPRYKHKSLKDLSLKELFNKKIDIEKSIKNSLLNLVNLVEKIKVPILSSEKIRNFYSLDGIYNKSISRAEIFNSYLSNGGCSFNSVGMIDVSKYNETYNKLVDKIESENCSYIKNMCEYIRKNETELELKKRAGIVDKPVTLRNFHISKIVNSSPEEYFLYRE